MQCVLYFRIQEVSFGCVMAPLQDAISQSSALFPSKKPPELFYERGVWRNWSNQICITVQWLEVRVCPCKETLFCFQGTKAGCSIASEEWSVWRSITGVADIVNDFIKTLKGGTCIPFGMGKLSSRRNPWCLSQSRWLNLLLPKFFKNQILY